ncbi:MAG: dihydroorotase [Gammaproteobacteria bacterium]
MQTLTLTQPDDWHLHLRDGDRLSRTVADASQRFARGIVMPNLTPPITSIELAKSYRQRILAAVPAGQTFQPLMTLYLTDQTTPEWVQQAKASGFIHAFKLYPAGATTHSTAGVTNIKKLYPVLEALQKYDLPLLIHGEVTTPTIDIFDREKYFLEQELAPLMQRFSELRVVLEHISTQEAVAFVQSANHYLAATITVHHLLLNRNHLLANGIRPHFYCLPILKSQQHQAALLQAAISGNPKFFLGTDSAPHAKSDKEAACGCAGIYTSHAAIELYAEVFEQMNALDKLEAFASFYGADFYRLPRNQRRIILQKKTWRVTQTLAFGQEQLIPLRGGEDVHWQIKMD